VELAANARSADERRLRKARRRGRASSRSCWPSGTFRFPRRCWRDWAGNMSPSGAPADRPKRCQSPNPQPSHDRRTQFAHSRRTASGKMGAAQIRIEADQSCQQAKFELIVVGSGLAGASAAATLAEQGYKVKCFLLSGLRPPGAFDRRAGGDQCGEKLPERRRLCLPAFLRYAERRRFPCTRSECLPPRRGERGYYRSVRGAGRAFCP
jgi:choline dehydrogenase-like flavoprotein